MPETPFFSVVIPLYNKEAYIADTLRAVLDQAEPDFEVLVINDGSTDRSLDVVTAFTDARIRVYTKKNGGVSSARNFGIRQARGKYIAFLDADDLWEPAYLQQMKKLIVQFPDCGLYGSAYKILENDTIRHAGGHMPEGIIEDYFKTELEYQISRTSATVVCHKVFEKIDGFPEGMIGGEDNFFFSRIAIHYKVAFTPQPLVAYNKESNGIAARFGKMDQSAETWYDLYEAGNYYRNEYIAYKGIENGIRHALGLHRARSRKMEECFQYTMLSRNRWLYLFFLNRVPAFGIRLLNKMLSLKNNYFTY